MESSNRVTEMRNQAAATFLQMEQTLSELYGSIVSAQMHFGIQSQESAELGVISALVLEPVLTLSSSLAQLVRLAVADGYTPNMSLKKQSSLYTNGYSPSSLEAEDDDIPF